MLTGRKVLALAGILGLALALVLFLACAAEEEEATPSPTTAVGATPTITPEEPSPTVEVGKPKYGGVLRYTSSAPGYWDPHSVTGGYKAAGTWTYIYQTLLCKDPFDPRRDPDTVFTWHWSGDLAESWEMLDDTTYVFHLREGIKWQNLPPVNGREVTADDVEYSFQRIKSLEGPGKSWEALEFLTDVEALDKYSVKFTLSRPWGVFLEMNEYYHTKIAPKEAIEAMGGDLATETGAKWEGTVGSGPFILDEYVPDSVVVLKRNPDYFKKDEHGNQLPYVDEIRLLVIPDPSTSLSALRAGNLDFRSISQISELESIKATNPELQIKKVLSTSGSGTGYVGSVNIVAFATDKPPFNDKRVRQAVALAFNRQEMADTYWSGEAEVKYWPVPPDYGEEWYVPIEDLGAAAKFYEYDPEEAKRLLAEAGYPDGFETTITYTLGYGITQGEYSELFADYMSKVGIQCTLKSLEYGAYYQNWMRNIPEGMSLAIYGLMPPWDHGGWSGESLGPGFGAWNRSGVDDPKINELLIKYLTSYDLETQQEALRDFQKYEAGEVYYVGLPCPYRWQAIQPWVKNIAPYRGLTLGALTAPYVWIDKD